jgi:hypothetical protein
MEEVVMNSPGSQGSVGAETIRLVSGLAAATVFATIALLFSMSTVALGTYLSIALPSLTILVAVLMWPEPFGRSRLRRRKK